MLLGNTLISKVIWSQWKLLKNVIVDWNSLCFKAKSKPSTRLPLKPEQVALVEKALPTCSGRLVEIIANVEPTSTTHSDS